MNVQIHEHTAPRRRGRNYHDAFFHETFQHPVYCKELFQLLFSELVFNLFDWTTLKRESSHFQDSQHRERRADLILSVVARDSGREYRMFFMIEHKSTQDSRAMQQILEYQTCYYAVKDHPLITILVYHGHTKKWKSPLQFQDAMKELPPSMREEYGSALQNFNCQLLNLRDEVIQQLAKVLECEVAVYILCEIRQLTDKKVKEIFRSGLKILDKKKREYLIYQTAYYIQGCHPMKYSINRLIKLEQNTLKEADRIMPNYQTSMDILREDALEEGLKNGREKEREIIALELIRRGADIDTISESTRLNPKRILELRSKIIL